MLIPDVFLLASLFAKIISCVEWGGSNLPADADDKAVIEFAIKIKI